MIEPELAEIAMGTEASKSEDARSLQDWAHISTIAAGIAACLGIGFGAWQLKSSADSDEARAKLEREIATDRSWERYMELAIEHPQYADGADFAKLGPEERVSYSWFVDRLLYTGESILARAPKDDAWHSVFKVEVAKHRSYFEGSPRFVSQYYCDNTDAMRSIIASVSVKAQAMEATCRKNRPEGVQA